MDNPTYLYDMNDRDRIEINGEWYVREQTLSKGIDTVDPSDLVFSKVITYEGDRFRFEACQLTEESGSPYGGMYVVFTDKRSNHWVEHNIDNDSLFPGLLKGSADAIESCIEIMNQEQLDRFTALLRYIDESKWEEI